MKLQSLILLALMGASITPIYGSESVPKTEEESKKRMALMAACAASGNEDKQLQDAVAILNELSGEDVDGDGKGLSPDLRKIVMGYAQQITAKELFESNSHQCQLVRILDSKQNPLTISRPDTIDIYDKNGKLLHQLSNFIGFGGVPVNTYFSSSFIVTRNEHNEVVLTGSFGEYREVLTWNVEDGKLLSQCDVAELYQSFAFDKHNTLLGVSKTYDGSKSKGLRGCHELKIWDVYKNTCIKELPVKDCSCCVLACDNDNKMIVVVGKCDGHIELWDIKTGERISVLRGHTGARTGFSKIVQLGENERCEVRGLAVCKNKKNGHLLIASSGYDREKLGMHDGLVYVWDAHTGECIQLLYKNDGRYYYGLRVAGMDYNDKDELEVYVHDTGNNLVQTLRCVPGDYEQVDTEIRNLEKATDIIQQQIDSTGTYNGRGLPPVLQRIVYEYAKPA
ncbi:MAG: hypothetical protein ACHQVS_04935 [Candidatus Babeliales bacterium]